ncbi:hypothetical protein [Shinella zoogloeoides]|uniref:hypothetical protein n=1 Tax=Shinella zoogloeoides TaxID=352475 RepID=UPI0028B08CF8|nr:hypothetical protein [Shinella zoogloeoides]
MANVTVPLSKSYTGHDGAFSSVELREPTFKEIYIDGLGEPQQWQPGPNGQLVLITLPDVINAYVEKLAVRPTADNLAQLNVQDSQALAGRVKGFFLAEPEPTKSPTSSSSGSDGMQAASGE